MKVKGQDDIGLNFMTVFADLGTIIIGFFIFIVVVLIKQLSQSEIPSKPIPSQYFISGDYLIPDSNRAILINDIGQTIYQDISKAFKDNNLKSVRIEGHTDPRKLPGKKKPELLESVKDIVLGNSKKKNDDKFKVTNNYELSFMRAQGVGNIFKEIIDSDSTIIKKKKSIFKKKMVYAAFGAAAESKYDTIEVPKGSGLYAVIDTTTGTLLPKLTSLSKEAAVDSLYKKLRRVEITWVPKRLK